MKADSEKRKTKLFFGGLAFVALLIDITCFSTRSRPASPPSQWVATQAQPDSRQPSIWEQQKSSHDDEAAQKAAEEAEASRKAAQEAAVKHAQFLAQYVNSDFARTPGSKTVALVIVSEDGKLSRALNDTFSSRFKSNSVQITTSIFRPQFVSDGLFEKALGDSNAVINKLELSKSMDVLLLGREEVNYSTDPSLENVISADMRLEITAISVVTGASQSWTFVANGSGFKKTESRQMAEERLIKQIARDTKMSLDL